MGRPLQNKSIFSLLAVKLCGLLFSTQHNFCLRKNIVLNISTHRRFAASLMLILDFSKLNPHGTICKSNLQEASCGSEGSLPFPNPFPTISFSVYISVRWKHQRCLNFLHSASYDVWSKKTPGYYFREVRKAMPHELWQERASGEISFEQRETIFSWTKEPWT